MNILITADRIRERVDELGAEIDTDFDGGPRVTGGAPDIGADEQP